MVSDDVRAALADRGIALLEAIFYGTDGFPGFAEELSSPELSELTLAQMATLLYLHTREARMGILAAHLRVGLSSMTSIADRLERRGLVCRRRDSADGRAVLCSLTSEGERRIDALFEQRRTAMVARLEGLDISELGTVAHALELIGRTGPQDGPVEH